MALVLCTGVDEALLQTRRLILESAGHRVVSVADEPALIAACEAHSFDVAVIGQTVTSKMKRRVASLVRQHCPAVKILELYQPHLGRTLSNADSWMETPADVPRELADRVDELAKKEPG